jgi:glutamate--cysteine ligase
LTLSLNDTLSALKKNKTNSVDEPEIQYLHCLKNIGHGIERETLRILPEGKLSLQPHPIAMGAALTHTSITTDYAESLMEFITPVSYKPEHAIAQLKDIQKFTLSNLDGELLWPFSMPCFVNSESDIALAYYGESNIGKMKTAYRQGLKNRYGSMMQVIAGIHFNFSFSEDYWKTLQQLQNNQQPLDTFKSDGYFSLIRNYKRFSWLIPYLYGSSPIICPSFLQGKEHALPFEKSPQGYLYLPYATSLRMSDLGYTSSEQAALSISYNSLPCYLAGVNHAMSLPSREFSSIGVKVDGEYQQLNSNVLQIENELYAPIRAKCVAKAGEKPSEALENRGVEYIEVRALDVNPFSETGISTDQVYFLDVLLTFCALTPSASLHRDEQYTTDKNMNEVVVRGRDPQLLLNDQGTDKSVLAWGNEIFTELMKVALCLDTANDTEKYSQAVTRERAKLENSQLTPSAQLVDLVKQEGLNFSSYSLDTAKQYRASVLAGNYELFNEKHFVDSAKKSHEDQLTIEEGDTVGFDQFLTEYFAD